MWGGIIILKFECGFVFKCVGVEKEKAASWLKQPIIFEQQRTAYSFKPIFLR